MRINVIVDLYHQTRKGMFLRWLSFELRRPMCFTSTKIRFSISESYAVTFIALSLSSHCHIRMQHSPVALPG